MPAPSVPVSPVRIAVIQFDPQVGLDQCDNNLCKGLQLAEEAVHDGANLIVLPELANTGYTFETRAEAYAHAETLDEGPSIKTWRLRPGASGVPGGRICRARWPQAV